jgi:hypothetical protein
VGLVSFGARDSFLRNFWIPDQSMKTPTRVDPHTANQGMKKMWQTVGVYAKGEKRPGHEYV